MPSDDGGVDSPKPHVNQADIAEALGLSQSTVSIALKGDTRVAEKTRKAIDRKAAELGYVPDPNLTALSLYRRRAKGTKVATGMAWVTNFSTPDGWKFNMSQAYRKGASERALQLGYQLYDFWLGDPMISARRLKQILLARGIRGLLFAPQPEFHTTIDFDFSDFAAVTFGYSLLRPGLHMVSNHQHRTVRLAYRSLQERGYRRIGILLDNAVDLRVDRNFSGGFYSLNPDGVDEAFLRPHLFETFDPDRFGEWFDHWRPDAIIVTGDSVAVLTGWLKNRGLAVGQDLAIAELNLNSEEGVVAGIDQQSGRIGSAAVDVLDSLLRHFEYGLPDQPLQTLVNGIWRDGKSAPDRRK